MEHNRLSSLCGRTMGKFPCHLCSTTRKHLASPPNVSLEKMTKGSKIKHIWDTNHTALKAMGYYACQSNVLYDLQYCNVVGGLNHALPPDILHAVLLGYVSQLVNGFTWLKKLEMIPCMFFQRLTKKKFNVICFLLVKHCQNKVILIYLAHIFLQDIYQTIRRRLIVEAGKKCT